MQMERLRAKQAFIIDLDGVVYHGSRLLAGVSQFMAWLAVEGKKFMFLTNASDRTPLALAEKLKAMGIQAAAADFYTSAQATAAFLAGHRPGARAYVIGEPCLTETLEAAGIAADGRKPDVVVVGETRQWSFDRVERAVNLVDQGARLIGTHPDRVDPGESGLVPSVGAMIAPIERATGKRAFFVGKPRPFMLRQALGMLGVPPEGTVIIGDRLDTDILAGLQTGVETVLVLSGIASRADLADSAFQPDWILGGVGDIAS